VDTGGRRRPPGTRQRALGLVALVIAVLSLSLGTAVHRSTASPTDAPALTHAVTQLHLAVRPGLDDTAVLVAGLVLPVALGLLLVGALPRRELRPVPVRRPRERAPPG